MIASENRHFVCANDEPNLANVFHTIRELFIRSAQLVFKHNPKQQGEENSHEQAHKHG